jgi:hypothetical protein
MGDNQGSSMPQWKGLFDWSMSYHDGTQPTNFNELGKADPDKMKWCVMTRSEINHACYA